MLALLLALFAPPTVDHLADPSDTAGCSRRDTGYPHDEVRSCWFTCETGMASCVCTKGCSCVLNSYDGHYSGRFETSAPLCGD